MALGITARATPCTLPADFADNDDDCDDGDDAINPDATEVCDEVDNDCDGKTDDDDASLDTGSAELWYRDRDGDGFGDESFTRYACEQPSSYVDDASDCNDNRSTINPDATEVCDKQDNDCDGYTDDDDTGLDTGTALPFYADADGDGYGDPDVGVRLCSLASGYASAPSDCDDADTLVNPGASEKCNSTDDDCDGATDEGYTGSGEDCPAGSCLELLVEDTASPDGDYWVDFDGTATETRCDMTSDGGGWTLVYEDDFESTVDTGWSDTSTTSCSGWGTTVLGGTDGSTTDTLSIDLDLYGIGHNKIWVQLDYTAIDSWDGESASMDVDGRTLWSTTFSHTDASYDSCGDTGWPDQFERVDESTTHTASTVTLSVDNGLDQSASDESMGIDNLEVWVR